VAHLLSTEDHYFDGVGLPVDVFHAKTKHKESDLFCQAHCNPARFRELVDGSGNWVFNSSAAEQANNWYGAFQSVVREMPVPRYVLNHNPMSGNLDENIIRYNFFLDEMIAVRNQFLSGLLHRRGKRPHLRPVEILRGA
jgi:hypothetical protein